MRRDDVVPVLRSRRGVCKGRYRWELERCDGYGEAIGLFGERALAELEASRVPDDAGTAEAAVGRGCEKLFSVFAVVANKVRRSVVAGAEFEETWRSGRGVEEPLLRQKKYET